MKSEVYAFDAYGTLFDVHSAVSRHFELVGDNPARVSEVWRNKQLEYTWVRSAMDRYLDFWTLTEQALDFALEATEGSNKDCKKVLLDAYLSLDCYDEVPQVLEQLQKSGAKLAILSNGSPDMLESAVNSAGLSHYFDKLFSVDEIGIFKTNPSTYAMVTNAFDVSPQQVAFQSSNRWDIAGAAAFGFQCHWINRNVQPDEYKDLPPADVMKDLQGLG